MMAGRRRWWHEDWHEGGRSRVPPCEALVLSVRVDSQPERRAMRVPRSKAAISASQNHWPVLISHKHVTAKLGHFPARGHQTEALRWAASCQSDSLRSTSMWPIFFLSSFVYVTCRRLFAPSVSWDLGTTKHSRLVTITAGGWGWVWGEVKVKEKSKGNEGEVEIYWIKAFLQQSSRRGHSDAILKPFLLTTCREGWQRRARKEFVISLDGVHLGWCLSFVRTTSQNSSLSCAKITLKSFTGTWQKQVFLSILREKKKQPWLFRSRYIKLFALIMNFYEPEKHGI